MNILGISCFYHDSAAVLVRDGNIIAAAQEERFTRKKHDDGFPIKAAEYCLAEAGIAIGDVDFVAFYDKPFLKFERILEIILQYAPKTAASFMAAIPSWLKEKFWIPSIIKKKLNYDGKILFPEHHQSHAASAFFPSPFNEAAFLTIDGVGEWATTSFGIGNGNNIEIKKEIHFPNSLGLLYSAFTYYTGFKVNSGEYKVMGLAPYGRPIYVDAIRKLINLKADGSFCMDMSYFNYHTGLTMTNKKFNALFGGPPRESESKLTQKEMDIARSLQDVTEEIMLRIVKYVHVQTGKRNLCLAGGVALNCVANGRILREGPFENIWIQPAAGDAGGALGAALFVWYQYLNNPRRADGKNDSQSGSYLGPQYSQKEVETYLSENNIPFQILEENELYRKVSEYIADGQVVGWFSGRMEFGPRALGARSILGDARSPEMQAKMNLKIKFRESFRPFAPSILEEHVSEYFDIDRPSPYMLLTAYVAEKHRRKLTEVEQLLWGIEKLNTIRSDIPAVTHVDYSARIQTVNKDTNFRYYKLIEEFYKQTGYPVIINTSFNVRGEPIVCTPQDAYRCFMRTGIDCLVIENCVMYKKDQSVCSDKENWRQTYQLD